MYIPTSFFSSQGACISASVNYISGSGIITSGSFVSQSMSWSYIQFEMSDKTNAALTAFTASLNILSGSTGQGKILIVGGGGTSATIGSINDGSDFAWNVSQAGGGGAGGVVYYNNFPLSSGSYEIGVASATSGNQLCSNTNTGALCGKVGKSSYIKLPNNFIYTPFSSSFLTAYGGGGGSPQGWYYLVSPFRPSYRNFYIDGAVFASAGGASGIEGPGSSPGNSSNTVAGGSGLGGLNGANQGQNGGAWQGGDPNNGYTDGGGPGGGGIGTAGANLGSGTGNFAKVTNGGDGLTYNLTGTTITVSNGGGGYNSVNPAATGQRGSSNADTYGSGGNGNGGTGNGGVVIVAWPICLYTASIIPIPPIPAPTFPGIEYLVLGGGGGGGASTGNGADYTTYYASGGGGAGALITGSMTLSTGSTYPIVIGNGGNGTVPNTISASNGSTTTAFGLTAIGGGFGGASNKSGSNGGSGGGAGGAHSQAVSGGIGVVGQGNNGGTNNTSIGTFIRTAGGGGGASEVGHPYTGTNPGYGGSGSAWLDGKIYAAGGGAGGDNTSYGLGGSGIGGNGQYLFSSPGAATTGSANRGSGGGGGCYTGGAQIAVGASGSAGVVVIRYDGTTPQATGGTITISGSCVYHTFTGSANLLT